MAYPESVAATLRDTARRSETALALLTGATPRQIIDTSTPPGAIDGLALPGDVTDAAGLRRLFTEQRPQVVYHAAAYKHVPMLEGQAREAVRAFRQGLGL